ncbi:alpha/beta hydrolase [Chitinophaga sp.]|uniref:alpha/beta hydrolase family protein n=1 Tax=Chitinophaga sp. TaxID=1869181 RepID=UPI002F9268FB
MSVGKIRLLLLVTALLCMVQRPLIAQNKRPGYSECDLNFNSNGNEIFGKLITPVEYKGKLPVIVFVHGSGPEDYSSSDNYRYLWEEFTKAGFACYSWNRPGVGQSQGKWYELSMEDRANEVISAVNKLKTLDITDTSGIGYWGISQAGWVIPLVSEKIKPAFVITVSSPVTTAFSQELYRVKSEMKADGFSRTDIRKAVAYNRKLKEMINGDKPYEHFAALQKEIKGAKWADNVIGGDEVVYKYLSIVLKKDNPPHLEGLNCPVLAIWGENDLMVPPRKGAATYRKVMKRIGNAQALIRIIPDADHTLTFNHTGKRAETIERRERYKDNPKEIFAPGYVSLMTDWLKRLNLHHNQVLSAHFPSMSTSHK